MANSNLSAARRAKQDEFYTQYEDIEKEMMAYYRFDSDVFRGKTILLPCDDPTASNFTRFFAQRFTEFGIAKLISTSYRMDGEPSWKYVLTPDDVGPDGRVDIERIEVTALEGNGDFRSGEVTALRDECDIVITNPPFSLFREFLAWIVAGDKQFSILANMNAVTYKEVFPLIWDNRVWLGATRFGVGSMWFSVPDDFPVKTGQRMEGDVRYQTVGNTCWMTNLEHHRRHEPIPLSSMADNITYGRNKVISEFGYRRYDNHHAIEVPSVAGIPSDYDGVMGVPITFLGKYDPEQFEIVGYRYGDDGKDLAIDGRTPYFRLLIRNRHPEKGPSHEDRPAYLHHH